MQLERHHIAALNHVWGVLIAFGALFIALSHSLFYLFGQKDFQAFGNLDGLIFSMFFLDALWSFIASGLWQRRRPSLQSCANLTLNVIVLAPMAWAPFYGDATAWVFLPFLKFFVVASFFVEQSHHVDVNPTTLRLILFSFCVSVLTHWAACGWIYLGGHVIGEAFDRSRYIDALYWSITTLTTVGYGDITPHNDALKIYTMIVMVLGVGVYGFVIGSLASVFSNVDLAYTAFRNRVERVMAYLRYRGVPKKLERQVQDYFDYLWTSRMAHSDVHVLNEIPGAMRNDVLIHLHHTLVQNVSFFRDADEAFLFALIPQLKPEVWMAGQTIFRAGEPGQEMYFISKGRVQIENSKGNKIAQLDEGGFFGELALIETDLRQATVVALTHCTTCALHKKDLASLLQAFPKFGSMLQEAIRSYKRESQ
jgi:hypothetical protein